MTLPNKAAVRSTVSLTLRASGKLLVAAGIAGTLFAATAQAETAAVVNGKAIPGERVDSIVKAMAARGQADTPALRKQVTEQLVDRELFLQEAERRKLDQDKVVADRLARQREEALISALAGKLIQEKPVTDEEIKAAYDSQVKKLGKKKEFKARHILVDSEDKAKAIVEKLGKGEKFADLAKGTMDTGSAQRGGDLGWNTPDTFVPEFSAAMTGLKKGEITKQPVKSQFGFHVIQLDDIRDATPPSLESMSAKLKQEAERNRIRDTLVELRKTAKVE